MEKDFHYYLIYAVSKITGFEKADWYLFHQAAKVHFATVLELTKEL